MGRHAVAICSVRTVASTPKKARRGGQVTSPDLVWRRIGNTTVMQVQGGWTLEWREALPTWRRRRLRRKGGRPT